MREPVRERAVVRQQQDAGRVAVEPADGDDPYVALTRSTTVGRPLGSLAVVIVPRGLLSSTWRSACLPTSRPSTRTTSVALDERVELPGAPVDRHPAGLDQLVGAATGGDTGAGEERVEAHDAILAG